jgi:hypothetical protein
MGDAVVTILLKAIFRPPMSQVNMMSTGQGSTVLLFVDEVRQSRITSGVPAKPSALVDTRDLPR